jgi:hypothetical protein
LSNMRLCSFIKQMSIWMLLRFEICVYLLWQLILNSGDLIKVAMTWDVSLHKF